MAARGMLSDLELLEKTKSGEISGNQFIRELFSRYSTNLYSYIFELTKDRVATEAVTQGVFLKLFQYLTQIKDIKNFRVWLYHIARNFAIDSLRAERRKELELREDSLKKDIIKDENKFEIAKKMSRAIDSLETDQRTVLLLKYINKLTFEEIAKTMSMSKNTVRSKYFTALEKLKEALKKKTSSAKME